MGTLDEFSISEVFESINGESSLMGYPALFIRFAGCNLRCEWCDTKHAYTPSYSLSYKELHDRIKTSKQRFVVLTGGEPLLQPSLRNLVDDIIEDMDKRVVLETNGSLSIAGINPRAHISLDCKTPSSLQHESCLFCNYGLLKRTDDVKFVIGDRADYEYSMEIVATYDMEKRANVIFQPVHGVLDAQMLATWIVEDSLEVRLSIQLHKYIGVK